MQVLEYLETRIKKQTGQPVTEEEWADVLAFEANHPELKMSDLPNNNVGSTEK